MDETRDALDEFAARRDLAGRAAHGGRSLQMADYDFPAETREELADALNYWTEHVRRRLAAERYPGRMEMTALVMARESIYKTYELIELALRCQEEEK